MSTNTHIHYNRENANIKNILADFNYIHPNIQFTIEETQNKLDYLDITIIHLHNTLDLNIFRNPTPTHSIVHNDVLSCFPSVMQY
jgi:hypothetical protein